MPKQLKAGERGLNPAVSGCVFGTGVCPWRKFPLAGSQLEFGFACFITKVLFPFAGVEGVE